MTTFSNTLGSTYGSTYDSTISFFQSSVAYSTASISKEPVSEKLFPLDQSPYVPYQEVSRETVLKRLEAQTISIETLDNVKLDAVWSVAEKEDGPTAILFHGNGGTLNAMVDFAKWYHDRGINTLLVTIRGYPGSEGSTEKTGELGLYLDVEAAVRYVTQTKGVSKDIAIAHGYSLGGSLAAAAGHFFGVNVALDHTFTRPGAVGAHITDKICESTLTSIPEPIRPSIPHFLPEGFVQGALPSGLQHEIAEDKRLPGSKPLVTDGLNSLEKVKKLDKELFIFFGEDDNLMPVSFSNELYEAKYGVSPLEHEREDRKLYQEAKANQIAKIPGGHWGVFGEYEDASEKYAQFLYKIGLLNKKHL